MGFHQIAWEIKYGTVEPIILITAAWRRYWRAIMILAHNIESYWMRNAVLWWALLRSQDRVLLDALQCRETSTVGAAEYDNGTNIIR